MKDNQFDTFDNRRKSALLNGYVEIEKEFVQFLKVVPLEIRNMHIWSPKLTSLIINSASLLDSVLMYKDHQKLDGQRNIKKHFDVHSCLLSGQWLVPRLFNSCLIHPFKEWHNQTAYQSVQWWQSYNLIKHNRIENLQLSTLENCLYSISALFLAICNNQSLTWLIEHNDYFSGDVWSYHYQLEDNGDDELQERDIYNLIETPLFSFAPNWCFKEKASGEEWNQKYNSSMEFMDWFRSYQSNNYHHESLHGKIDFYRTVTPRDKLFT